MELFDNVTRNLNLIKKAREVDSPKYRTLIYPELTASIQSTGIDLICINSNYAIEGGLNVDFSFYYHPLKVIVLNYQTIKNKQLEPFWGKDFRLAYNLILIHELGHFLAFNHNDFTENGAWMQGLLLAEYLGIFTPQLAQLFKNYFIV
jgi:hypothetical protein